LKQKFPQQLCEQAVDLVALPVDQLAKIIKFRMPHVVREGVRGRLEVLGKRGQQRDDRAIGREDRRANVRQCSERVGWAERKTKAGDAGEEGEEAVGSATGEATL
jgi:hypothetical protein